MSTLRYLGTKLLNPVSIKENGVDKPREKFHPYLPDPDLVKAVNLAILIKRPLLLMGEPGCGKSILAKALAYEIHHNQLDAAGNTKDFRDYFFEWNIKSSSKAQDGLYEFDAIRRLGEAQILSQKNLSKEEFEKELEKDQYITLQPMGEAFVKSKDDTTRAVLLIDEIDKADIDFPNDLLNELDKSRFTIKETKKTIRSEAEPIVIITSNDEKDLPDAFLRRCVYHYIKPLKRSILEDIIKGRFFSKEPKNEELIKKALDQFITIRKHLRANKTSVGKNVSTSELLDWFEAIKHYHQITEKGTINLEEEDNADLKNLITELKNLGSGVEAIPFQQVLFKNWNTLIHFEKQ